VIDSSWHDKQADAFNATDFNDFEGVPIGLWNKNKKEAYLINHLTVKVTLAHVDDNTFRITAFDVTPLSYADGELRLNKQYGGASLY
jgi:hypothetical protein